MKVVFFGTPYFAANVLDFLLDHGIEVVAVITKPDRPKGRSKEPIPTPVKIVAQHRNIPVFQPPIVSSPENSVLLSSFDADFFVVVAYGEIIKQHLLDMPRLGCINLHGSLLPKYRGAAPIQRSIMNGDAVTGVTIMHMVRKMDAGDIIRMAEIPIGPDEAFPEIEHKLCVAGSNLLLQVLEELRQGRAPRIPQNEELVSYAAKVELEDCQLNWQQSAAVLHNLVRAVAPEPGAWCEVKVQGQPRRLKVYASKVVSELTGKPGELLAFGKEGIVVACGQQALRLLQVQIEGKKAMSAEELVRGLPHKQILFF